MILTLDRHIETLINRLSINNMLMLLGRALMAYLFIIAGWNKMMGYVGTAAYMESQGIPGSLVYLVILLEFGGGLAVLIGYQTRLVTFFLACFCIASGLIFHSAPAGKLSIDHLLMKK